MFDELLERIHQHFLNGEYAKMLPLIDELPDEIEPAKTDYRNEVLGLIKQQEIQGRMATLQSIADVLDRFSALPDEDVLLLWSALRSYQASDQFAPGMLMDGWAELVYSEKSRRGL